MIEMNFGEICSQLDQYLRLRSRPLAMKLYERLEDMEQVSGVRRPKPGVHYSFCQLVGQVRWLGWTLGVTKENVVPASNCGGVVGIDAPGEKYLDGTMFHGVWFKNCGASCKHQEEMPRVPHGRYQGILIAPLSKGKISNPDTVLIYATPGQMILIINALQHRKYTRYQFGTTGETACADSWGNALLTGEPSISIPCFAERRFGGVQDDEMLIALPLADLQEVVDGLQWLSGNGLRYPIAPYGVQCDPAEAFDVNYADKR